MHETILLHVWGFLGDVTWALSHNNAVVHCYVSLATQQFLRMGYPQHCYERDNRHGNVSIVTGLLSTDFCWFVVSPCLEIAECRRVCLEIAECRRVCLATDCCRLEDWVSTGKLREKLVCLEASWLQEWEFVPDERRGWARTCVWRLWLQECEFVLGDYQQRSCRKSLVWDIAECRRLRRVCRMADRI
jgi:hypothetical protein